MRPFARYQIDELVIEHRMLLNRSTGQVLATYTDGPASKSRVVLVFSPAIIGPLELADGLRPLLESAPRTPRDWLSWDGGGLKTPNGLAYLEVIDGRLTVSDYAGCRALEGYESEAWVFSEVGSIVELEQPAAESGDAPL